MADDMARADEVENLTPEQVAEACARARMLLVDVREPNETAVGKLSGRGASCRCRASIPPPSPIRKGKQVVFACRSGRRSVTASLAAQDQGYPYKSHLAGGIIAWKAAGLPTKRLKLIPRIPDAPCHLPPPP